MTMKKVVDIGGVASNFTRQKAGGAFMNRTSARAAARAVAGAGAAVWMRRCITVAAIALSLGAASVAHATFPTRTFTKNLTLANLRNDFSDFSVNVGGFEDITCTFTYDQSLAGYYVIFKVTGQREGGTGVAYVVKNVGDVTVSTSNVTFSVSHTNDIPNGSHYCELLLLDTATTNTVRIIGRGRWNVSNSLFDDDDDTWTGKTVSLTDYLTKLEAAATYQQTNGAAVGTITGVTAGYGLTGGGTNGAVTVAVDSNTIASVASVALKQDAATAATDAELSAHTGATGTNVHGLGTAALVGIGPLRDLSLGTNAPAGWTAVPGLAAVLGVSQNGAQNSITNLAEMKAGNVYGSFYYDYLDPNAFMYFASDGTVTNLVNSRGHETLRYVVWDQGNDGPLRDGASITNAPWLRADAFGVWIQRGANVISAYDYTNAVAIAQDGDAIYLSTGTHYADYDPEFGNGDYTIIGQGIGRTMLDVVTVGGSPLAPIAHRGTGALEVRDLTIAPTGHAYGDGIYCDGGADLTLVRVAMDVSGGGGCGAYTTGRLVVHDSVLRADVRASVGTGSSTHIYNSRLYANEAYGVELGLNSVMVGCVATGTIHGVKVSGTSKLFACDIAGGATGLLASASCELVACTIQGSVHDVVVLAGTVVNIGSRFDAYSGTITHQPVWLSALPSAVVTNNEMSVTLGGPFAVGTGTAPALYATAAGRVGIGTNAPGARLHVNATATNAPALRIDSPATWPANATMFDMKRGSTSLLTCDEDGDVTAASGYYITAGGRYLGYQLQLVGSTPKIEFVDSTGNDDDWYDIANGDERISSQMVNDSTEREMMRLGSFQTYGGLWLSAYSTNAPAARNDKAAIFARYDPSNTNITALYCINDQGTVTKLSSHEGLVHVADSYNQYTGEGRRLDLWALADAVEQLTGKKIVTRYTVPRRDWNAEQDARKAESDAAISAWERDERPAAEKGERPSQYIRQTMPPAVRERLLEIEAGRGGGSGPGGGGPR